MRRSIKLNNLIVGAALLAASPLARALNQDSLEQKLKEQYPLTKLTDDKAGVVTAGAVLTLKMDGLKMTLSGSADVSGNTYNAGKITQSAAGRIDDAGNKGKNICTKIPFVKNVCPPDVPAIPTRTFVKGEKLYVTKIGVKENSSIAFELFSVDAHSDNYHWTTLTFLFENGGLSADQAQNTIAEVFTVTSPETQRAANQPEETAGGQAVTATKREPETLKPDELPPPSATAPNMVSIGDTKDQVVRAYGQPESIAKPAGREIYFYKYMKVIFVDSKVSDIQ